MKRTLYILPIAALLLSACLKREPVNPADHSQQAGLQTLRVEVALCQPAADPYCQHTTPVFQAAVALYASLQSYDNGDEAIRQGATDAGGVAVFSGLDGFRYYAVISSGQHFTEESVSIPPAGVGNLRIVLIE